MTTLLCDESGLTAFWSEEADLLQLGTCKMRRATCVEFNESAQVWEVFTPDFSQRLFSHPSRNTCLQWEHDNQETIITLC
jgi:hypothetical protein